MLITTPLQHALYYFSLGLNVIPVLGYQYLKDHKFKSPMIAWKRFQKEKINEKQIKYWWSKYEKAGIGIITGKISNLVVIDFDSDESIKFGIENALFDTVVVRTKRGFHAYFKYPENIEIPTVLNFSGIKLDIKSDGGYVLAPPTMYSLNEKYSFERGKEPWNIAIAPLPEIILKALPSNKTTVTVAKNKLLEFYNGAKTGERNIALTKLAGSWIRDGISYEECLNMAFLWNQKNNPPLKNKEIEKTIKSIYNRHLKNNKNSVNTAMVFAEKNFLKLPLFVYNKELIHKPGKIEINEKEKKFVVYGSIQYGLPGPFDETVYMALLKLLSEKKKPIENPVAFSLNDIIKLMNAQSFGGIRRLVKESLKRIRFIIVETKGFIYDNQRKIYVEDNFSIFDRLVFISEKLPDGQTAKTNYLWLSEVMINNINSGYVLPLNYEKYVDLPTGISKGLYRILFPLLNRFKKANFKIKYSVIQQRLQLPFRTSQSLMIRQLEKALHQLINKKIISGYSVIQEKNDFSFIILP